MRSTKKLPLSVLAVGIVGAAAFFGYEAVNSKSAGTTIAFENESQKEAYTLGASIGDYMAKQLKDQNDLDLNLDQAMIIKGFEQGLAGNPQLTKEEIDEILRSLDKKVAEKRQEKAAVLAKENLEKGNEFLEKNKSKNVLHVTCSLA